MERLTGRNKFGGVVSTVTGKHPSVERVNLLLALAAYEETEYTRNMALARIDELQAEESAILHEMERPRCRYAERAKLATKLQKILAERRGLKDWMRCNKNTLAYMDSDKGGNLQKWLDSFIGAARKDENKFGLLLEPFEEGNT